MLIKSSFKDFYDAAAGLGIDTSVVFERETATVELEGGFFMKDLPAYFPDNLGEIREGDFSEAAIALHNQKEYCQFSVIGFCGQIHVCAHAADGLDEKKHRAAYFGEEILALDWGKKPGRHGASDRAAVGECVKIFHGKTDHTFFKMLAAPIFFIEFRHPPNRYERKNWPLYRANFIKNPRLADLQFYKTMDAFSAFQAIQSYLSGVLGGPERPMIELSDRSKILKAGFDLKTSFRKPKT